MKNNHLREKLKYWFDNQMARGVAVMIGMLTLIMLCVVILLSIAIVAANGEFGEGTFGETLWNVLSTTINAWMPEAEDSGWTTFFVSVSAIFGLFFTSFIIGIITSGVEDRLTSLRQGNSKVMESGHIVVLGYKSGEYTLLQQLVLAAGSKKACIVAADHTERTEMEDALKSNLQLPANVKLICRNLDTEDPVALECCSLETASLIVISPIDDGTTLKTMLAVHSYFEGRGGQMPRVVTAVADDEFMIPYSTRKKYGFTVLRTNEIIARIISHSCAQAGLSTAFLEVFDYNGNEFYIEAPAIPAGTRFKDILYYMEHGVPIGVLRNGTTLLNPDRDMPLEADDKLIVFERFFGECSITENKYIEEDEEDGTYVPEPEREAGVCFIGCNDKLERVLSELPAKITHVIFAGADRLSELAETCREIDPSLTCSVFEEDVMDLEALEALTENISHVVILSDSELEEEDADARTMMQIIKLRDIKDRLNRTFTITAELRRDDNRRLIALGDGTDFIVSSNLSAMVLTQIAQNEALYDTFHELLSTSGNEFELHPAAFISNCVLVQKTVADLRRELVHKGCIFLGYVEAKTGVPHLNPWLSEKITLQPGDKLMVIRNAR